ncbi:hypothetical protein RJ641_009928 [Dillenia turbinata]|uniref:Uncharacterized protein n=1 Tax=Dillenia turbinata TaxID=194707 RepID=A0AAN8V9J7_9MAGN
MSHSDSDIENGSDVPEEFTYVQGIHQEEKIRKVERENKARLLEIIVSFYRVAREGKERRRKWAQRRAGASGENKEAKRAKETEEVNDGEENESDQDALGTGGMLPSDIVKLLAAREKQVFSSDSEDEKRPDKKPTSRKKRQPESSGEDTVILKDIPPPQCIKNSLDFLKKRKMQVPRSSSVLNNSNKALRLLSNTGLLYKK